MIAGSVDSAVWGFAGVVVGGCITVLVEMARLGQSRRVERERLEFEIRNQRDDFQRNNLIELQEQLILLARTCAEVSIHDKQALVAGRSLELVPDELATDFMLRTREYNYRMERVLSQPLRQELREFRDIALQVASPGSGLSNWNIDSLNRWEIQLTEAFGRANDALGSDLRGYLAMPSALTEHQGRAR